MRQWVGLATFAGLYVLSVVSLGIAAASCGIAIGEDARLSASHAVGSFYDRIASGEASFFDPVVRDATWGPIRHAISLPTLLSAFVWHVASSGYDWWPELVSLRLGYIALAALGVPALAAIMSPAFGSRAALFGAVLLAFVPRAMHQAVLADPRALVATAWLLVILCYVRARHASSGKTAWAWNVATGVVLGLAAASSHGTLCVLAVLLAHTCWSERKRLRSLAGQGFLPLPLSLLPCFLIAPVVYVAATPWLWNESGTRARALAVDAFRSASGQDGGASIAALSLVTSVSTVTLFAAGIGLAVVAGPARWRRWAQPPRVDSGRDESSLVVVALLVALLWPWLMPQAFQPAMPRWVPAVPFVAALAGVGLDRTVRGVSSCLADRPAAVRNLAAVVVVALCVGVPLVQTVFRSTTRSAAFSPLAGGPAWVATHPDLPLHDGSPAVALCSAIDALVRPRVTLHGPVPAAVWRALRRFGPLRTEVRPTSHPHHADLLVVDPGSRHLLAEALTRGQEPALLRSVRRDGVEVLALYGLRRR